MIDQIFPYAALGLFIVLIIRAFVLKTRTLPKYSLRVLLLLGISPVGMVVPYILLNLIGVCRGALGSGISCGIPIIGSYLESVAGYWEVSMIVLIGFVWTALAFGIWGLILVRLYELVTGQDAKA